MTFRPNVAVYCATASGPPMWPAFSKAARFVECTHRSLASKVHRIWRQRRTQIRPSGCVTLKFQAYQLTFQSAVLIPPHVS